ncbi:MAG: DNA repair protein [Curvibacter sp.]|nr:DNA repair protein [Curvibacter sp.]
MSHNLISSLSAFDGINTHALLVREIAGRYRQAQDSEVLQAAQALLAAQLRGTDVLSDPVIVRTFLQARLGTLGYEVFAVVHLDAQHRVIDFVEMFRGTLTQTSVYPRELVKDALRLNSAAVILVHNHPSGSTTPSSADERLTSTLKTALGLVDVRVLDHFVVAASAMTSMAESGLI